MKIRGSFVTNSSSSSYIISIPKDNSERARDFFDIASELDGYETDAPHMFSTEKELNNYVVSEYHKTLPELLSGDSDWYKDTFTTILNELKKSNIVIMQDISYGQGELYEKIMRYVLRDYSLVEKC